MTNINLHHSLFKLRRKLTLGIAVATALTALPAASQNAAWPTKPIRIVIGFAAGGTTDVMARTLSLSLTESLGQPVIVDNKPGASGNIGASEVVKAPADGYTFLIAPTSVETANPSLFKSTVLPSRDLTPVMGIGKSQMYLIARPDFPAKDVHQLIALAKSQPGRLSYASSGAGTALHLAGELFKQSTGTFITHIPYRGSGPAVQDVMGSQVDLNFDSGVSFPFIRTGKVKLLAVASDKKSPFFPDAPTYADLGIQNASLDIWFGLWAPNNTSTEITNRISREISKVLANPSIKQKWGELGAEPVALENAAFRKLLTDEGRTLSNLIKTQKIIAD